MITAVLEKPMLRLKKKPITRESLQSTREARIKVQTEARERLKKAGLEAIEEQMAKSNVRTSRSTTNTASAQKRQASTVKTVTLTVKSSETLNVDTNENGSTPMFPDAFAPRFKNRDFTWPFCSEEDIAEMIKIRPSIFRHVTA